MDFARVVKTYLKIREARTTLKREYEEKDNKLKEKLNQLEAVLLSHLNESKTESVRTEFGTFYRQEDITPTGSDWDAFYRWIAEHNAFDALERRIKKVFIKEYMETNDGGIPPGVTIYREFVVRVRRS